MNKLANKINQLSLEKLKLPNKLLERFKNNSLKRIQKHRRTKYELYSMLQSIEMNYDTNFKINKNLKNAELEVKNLQIKYPLLGKIQSRELKDVIEDVNLYIDSYKKLKK